MMMMMIIIMIIIMIKYQVGKVHSNTGMGSSMEVGGHLKGCLVVAQSSFIVALLQAAAATSVVKIMVVRLMVMMMTMMTTCFFCKHTGALQISERLFSYRQLLLLWLLLLLHLLVPLHLLLPTISDTFFSNMPRALQTSPT